MKNSSPFRHFAWLLALALAAMTSCAGKESREEQAAASQRMFASPGEAAQALLDVAKGGDESAMQSLFGPDFRDFLTGDKVQDKANFEKFVRAMEAGCVQSPEGNDKVVFDIGADRWPFAIPVVKKDGQWFFDTDAGREEVMNRHIGGDELHAIGVCRAYVAAQRQYFSKAHDDSGVQKYALKFRSTAGKQDGLYWAATGERSPFGPLVAEAHAEGYRGAPSASRARPFHGYLFRILTCQGPAAPGGECDYVVNGNMTRGFALVAYPVHWGRSGIMTFIVNQDGKVYQRDFGKETLSIVGAMTLYNPDKDWMLVKEEGVSEEASSAAMSTGEAMSAAPASAKDEAVKAAQDAYDTLEKQWKELEAKTAPATDEAKADFQKAKDQMAQALADAKAKLVEAKDTGADAWQNKVKPAFDSALEKARKLYQNAAAKFGG